MPDYDALQIRLDRLEPDADTYRVHARATTGEVTGTFTVPLSRVELENLVPLMNRARAGVPGPGSPELGAIRNFGSDLFSALFTGPMRDLYRDGMSAARASGKGLRITLGLTDTPELMDLPWEYLYEKPDFISISTWTPVVRYLELPHSRKPLEVTPPLRLLALVSSPSDVLQLDVARERRKLEDALAGATGRGAAEIHWVERATLSELLRSLRRADFHVFHYIGHGEYDADIGDGVLLLEDENGESHRVRGDQLGTMLADEATLRLAVLNACEGARASATDPFAGVATSLVQRQIPAVVAMQFEITDEAAITFAAEFYAAIADGYPVDFALGEARRMIYAGGNETEWATPVLFMRVADGRVFDVRDPIDPQPIQDEPPPPPPPPPVSLLWTAVALGVAGLFVVGLLYPWDDANRSWVDRQFDASAGSTGNVLSALSPIALIAGTAIAVLLARLSRSWRLFAAGLAIGLGIAGAAKYGAVLLNQLDAGNQRIDSVVVLGLVVAASCLLAVLGSKITASGEDRYVSGSRKALVVGLAIAGAALVLAGCAVDYNSVNSKSIFADDGWFALDPLAGVLVGLGAISVGRSGLVGAGALIAVGVVGVALWARFIGVPIVLDDTVGSAAPGGFIGLLGSLCLVAAGVVLAWTRGARRVG
jgi:CHAT domain